MIEARNFLNSVRDIERTIRNLEKELEILRRDIDGLGAMDYSRFRVSGGVPSDIADTVSKLEKLERAIVNEKCHLATVRAEVIAIINKLERPEHKEVLIGRYIENKVWDDILPGFARPSKMRLHREALEAFEILMYSCD